MSVELNSVSPAPIDPAATQVMVPMRDGVRLATDVYLPEKDGSYPAILVRLPYDKCGMYTFMPLLAPHINARGYGFVVQDVRGKFRSEGETVAFDFETQDGFDTLDWLANQPWCSGRVGMFGDSYYGFTQWAAVASGHPALKAMVPRVTAADLGPWLDEATPLYGAGYLVDCWTDQFLHSWEVDWAHRPLSEVFDAGLAEIGSRSVAFDRLLRGEQVSGWDHAEHPFSKLSIPVLHVVGWFDNVGPAHMRDYDSLIANPATKDLQYLFAGSYDHENYELSRVPVEPHPEIAGSSSNPEELDKLTAVVEQMLPLYLEPALDFFDYFLGDVPGTAPPPRVRWELGHDGWRTGESWPLSAAQSLSLHLSDLSRATEDARGGLLGGARGEAETVTWIHDPTDLVPSVIENPFAFLMEYPDEQVVESRPDVLTFTTKPLSSDLDLAGPITVELNIQIAHDGGRVHARLLDVEADGVAHAIAIGQTTVAGNAVSPTVVSLGHTGYRVRQGHCLRLHVAASDFPLFMPDSGTGENPWTATQTNRVAYELRSPSVVTLSVLPGA